MSCSGPSEYSPAPTGAATTRVRQGCPRLRINGGDVRLFASSASSEWRPAACLSACDRWCQRAPEGAARRQHRRWPRAFQRHSHSAAAPMRSPMPCQCQCQCHAMRQRVGAHAHPLHRRPRRRRPPSASTAAPTQEVCVRVCMCVCMCACVCVRACVCASVRVRYDTIQAGA